MKKTTHFLKNLIVPTFVFGFITGVLAGGAITLFKFCASHVIEWSEITYAFMRYNVWLPIILTVPLFFVAIGFAFFYKTAPNTKGGGIPTAIAIVRGVITFKWYRNLFNVFFASMLTFFVGVPLGTEGPSVQIGTALGRGSVNVFGKKNKAWDRYVMTGGASAGFAVATGAPLSGLLFAVEEAHQRVSPMIILVSLISVAFAYLVSSLLSQPLGVSTSLFPNVGQIPIEELSLNKLWLPLIIGVAIGLFSTFFIKVNGFIRWFWNTKLAKIKLCVKIFLCFFVTLIFGLISYSFISTGNKLILDIISNSIPWYLLLAILAFRLIVMLTSNSSGITGGLFLPILALGAILSGLLGQIFVSTGALNDKYYSIIVMLGLTACMAGMMKTPLTAITFALEALALANNVISVIIVVAVSYMITEIFGAHSIYDAVIKERIDDNIKGKKQTVIDTFLTVQEGCFVQNRQIRDILWPHNLFVLSVKQCETSPVIDSHGDKYIHVGDVLHVRYSTYDAEETKKQIFALVGEQELSETAVRKV